VREEQRSGCSWREKKKKKKKNEPEQREEGDKTVERK
jgi:hypothetical protein